MLNPYNHLGYIVDVPKVETNGPRLVGTVAGKWRVLVSLGFNQYDLMDKKRKRKWHSRYVRLERLKNKSRRAARLAHPRNA